MKPLLTLTFSLILGLFLFAAPATFAQQLESDSFQAEINTDEGTVEKGFVPCSGTGCSACDFVIMANTIIKWLISISFLFFGLLAMIAGFKLLTAGGNSGALREAKSSFTNAFIGLIIILAAWLLVDTLIRTLVKNTDGSIDGYGPWSQIQCGGQALAETKEGYYEGDPEYELPPPNDNTIYSGQPTTGTDRCTPIPDSQLATFPAEATYGSPERALPDTVNRFMSMRAEAAKKGINLKVSDGYRAPSEQLSAWNQNGCRLVNGRTVCSTRTAAVPCSMGGGGSNHTLGNAVDIRIGPKEYDWLRANGATFGFKNYLPNDKPHWSPTGR